jgi:hypothetical protein
MGDDRLLARMRASKAGWGWNDLNSLYTSFGFASREGGKHTVYVHEEHRDLRATVARHRSLPVGYIQTAIKLIDEAHRRDAHRDETD